MKTSKVIQKYSIVIQAISINHLHQNKGRGGINGQQTNRQRAKVVGMLLVLGQLAVLPTHLIAQKAVAPQFSPIATIFGNWSVDSPLNGDPSMAFNLERAYLGVTYRLDDKWSAKMVYSMENGGDSKHERIGYVKHAEIIYQKKKVRFSAGLISTTQFGIQEKFWGYRYLYKSFQDQRKWGSSVDLGVSAQCRIADWLSADISVFNGEGYKQLQTDSHFQYAFGITAAPIENLTLRGYTDLRTIDNGVSQQNFSLFAGYCGKKIRIGVEYALGLKWEHVEDYQVGGISFFATTNLGCRHEIYVRYDDGFSSGNNGWSYNGNGQACLLGWQYKANDLFSISPNLRYTTAADGTESTRFLICIKASL